MAVEAMPQAVNVNRGGGTMEIVWEDGRAATFNLMKLRRICPCATCAGERGENPHPGLLEARAPDEPAPKKKSLGLPILGNVNKFQIKAMNHVGNYALGVTWEDGHQSIFAWAFLAAETSA